MIDAANDQKNLSVSGVPTSLKSIPQYIKLGQGSPGKKSCCQSPGNLLTCQETFAYAQKNCSQSPGNKYWHM